MTAMLIEQMPGLEGDRITCEWYCPVPGKGVPFRVIRQEWDETYTVRRIYEIETCLPDVEVRAL